MKPLANTPTLSGRPGPACTPAHSGRPAVAWVDATGRLAGATVAWLDQQAHAALDHLAARQPGVLAADVRVRIVDDAEMDAAHRRYCNVPGTTDVLTFDLREPMGDASQPLDTDLFVCLDQAQRAAAAHGHDAARELLLYFIHGVLHCLGEDDHDDDAAARMHAREDEVLAAIGVGPVFSPPASQGAPHHG